MAENGKTPGGAAAEMERETPGHHGPRVFVVGLGQTGRELIKRLARHMPVVGIDHEEKKIELMNQRAAGEEDLPITAAKRDGASRLTWEDLGLQPGDIIVTATRRDEVNLEVCRVAREGFGVKKLYGLIHSTRRAGDYTAAGIETVSRAHVLASFLEGRILGDRRSALNVGLGQGEIVEVPVLPGSPVIGKPLSAFHARPWLVGAIYRRDKLIVPHGRTVIEVNDRVVLVGEPHVLSGIADFFKLGEAEFPLQYGPRIGVLAGKGSAPAFQKVVTEAGYLTRNSKATSVVLLHLPHAPEPDVEMAGEFCGAAGLSCEPAYLLDEEDTDWVRSLQAHDFGCLVVGAGKLGLLARLGLSRSLLLRIIGEADFPVLIPRGSHPYKHILAPVVAGSNADKVTELALNLARLFEARLDAITVTEPAFAAGSQEVEEQKRILDRVHEHSALYRQAIGVVHREGNPIREVVRQSQDYNLLVLGYRQSASRRPRLDIALEILARVKCSVMILPYKD